MLEITIASAGEIEIVQGLWQEYWASFGLDPEFQNFGEELRALPGPYALPRGRLLLARWEGEPAGTAALRPISDDACEAKRLYVRPLARGKGLGRILMLRLIDEARSAGYRELYGDTLTSMKQALEMYKRMGFTEVGPYSANPTPGAIFIRLTL